MIDNKLKDLLKEKSKEVVERIVDRTLVEQKDHPFLGRLTSVEVDRAIREYPGTITAVPNEEFERAYIMPILLSVLPRWRIEVDLWYDNRRSDLRVLIAADTQPDGSIALSLDDILVP